MTNETVNNELNTTLDETVMVEPIVEVSEEPALTPVERIVVSFRDRMVMDNGSLLDLQVKGLSIVWQQIAAAYELILTIFDPGNADDYKAVLARCGIPASGLKGNKFLPVTKLLFGSFTNEDGTLAPWDSAQDSIFETDRSAEKYACVFRYFDHKGIPACDVFDAIKNFDEAPYGRNLKGIEAKDRATNGKGSKSDVSDADAISLGADVQLADVFEFERPEGITADQGVALFRVVGSRIFLLGHEELNDADFNKKALARGKKLISANAEKAEKVSKTSAVRDLLKRKAA